MSVDSPSAQSVLSAGTPCWVELATVDEAAVTSFYGRLFEWDCYVKNDPATASRRYTIASRDGVATAGFYQAAAHQRTGWTVHLAVQNTDTTAGWVEHLGGEPTLGPIDIPDRGSILHATDPCGAHVVFWQPSPAWEFAYGTPGAYSGADLYTHDGVGADRFYCRLFNFTSEQIGLNNIDFAEWRLDRHPVLYRYVMGTDYLESTPSHWMVHFTTDPGRGTDAVAGHAIMLGGTVVIEPYDTPFGRVAVLADPGGSIFAVIDHSRVVEGWGRAEVDDPYTD